MNFTWHTLNKALMALNTEAEVKALIEAEMRKTYPRERWVLRMFSRLHRLRNLRETEELRAKLRGVK